MTVIDRHIKLRGPHVEFMRARDPEILMAGPAGSAKSTTVLLYLHLLALKYPRIRVLMVRKTAISLANTTLVTFENYVATEALRTRDVQWFGGSTHEPPGYRYSNGSRINTGGMDNPDRVLSSEYDIIFVEEATEITEGDWEVLSSRLRNGVLPWQQIIACCNPVHASHWLKKRSEGDNPSLRMIESRLEDNPAYFDDDGNITPQGEKYIARLDRLTGVRKERLRYGRWVSAEGIIYDTFDTAKHVIDPIPLDPNWTRYWSIDFGTHNPFVWASYAEDHDGNLYLYREWYKTGELIERHAQLILDTVTRPGDPEKGEPDRVWLEPTPAAIICDHDLQGRMILEDKLGMGTVPAYKSVLEGIQAVSARFASKRLFIFNNASLIRDPHLLDSHRPTSTVEELGGYVWDQTAKANGEDRPIKKDDHGCLVAGTLVTTEFGDRPIETILSGERVWTRRGLAPVKAAGMTSAASRVFRVSLSDGGQFDATGSHPVWVEHAGWVRVDSLRYADRLSAWSKPSLTTASSTAATRTPSEVRIATTSPPALRTSEKGLTTSTGRSGKTRTAQSPRVAKSTMPITTTRTTTSQTLPVSREPNTRPSIGRRPSLGARVPSRLPSWLASDLSRLPGTRPPRDLSGTGNTRKSSVSGPGRNGIGPVTNAERNTRRGNTTAVLVDSARTTASQPGGARRGLTTDRETANGAGNPLSSTATPFGGSAGSHVLEVTELPCLAPVFNLTIDGEPEFYANGILVHNCDAMRYLAAYVDLAPQPDVRVMYR